MPNNQNIISKVGMLDTEFVFEKLFRREHCISIITLILKVVQKFRTDTIYLYFITTCGNLHSSERLTATDGLEEFMLKLGVLDEHYLELQPSLHHYSWASIMPMISHIELHV